MNNVVFEKNYGKFEQTCKLVTTERRRNYLVSEPNYHTTKFLTENLSAMQISKIQIPNTNE